MYDQIVGEVVMRCRSCKQRLRIPLFRHKTIEITCPKCKSKFDFDCRRYRLRKETEKWTLISLIVVAVMADFILPMLLINKANATISEVKRQTESAYAAMVQRVEKGFQQEIETIKKGYNEELAGIDPNTLRLKAKSHYEEIWAARSNFDRRYAISPREKAQLEMLLLAKDATGSVEKTIRDIARMAAPKNSLIATVLSSDGISVEIEFDMSELTSGENGTRTKHLTLTSLKQETVRLISRVTNDVYQFCGDLGLESIRIGCRHFVEKEGIGGTQRVENMVIYKIKLDKTRMAELEHNPFLDVYSTTKYFEVIEDHFDTLTITTEVVYE